MYASHLHLYAAIWELHSWPYHIYVHELDQYIL